MPSEKLPLPVYSVEWEEKLLDLLELLEELLVLPDEVPSEKLPLPVYSAECDEKLFDFPELLAPLFEEVPEEGLLKEL